MEDARRKRVTSSGKVEALCTLCEEEGRPHVPADHSYVVVSTMTGNERLITICSNHADQLDKGKLSYTVATRKKGFDWTSGAEEKSGRAKAGL